MQLKKNARILSALLAAALVALTPAASVSAAGRPDRFRFSFRFKRSEHFCQAAQAGGQGLRYRPGFSR